MNKSTFNEIVLLVVRYLTRLRSPSTIMFYAGLSLIAITLGGQYIQLSLPLNDGVVSLTWDMGNGTPALASSVAFWIGIILLSLGTFSMLLNAYNDHCANERRRIFVVEQRGLRDTSDTPVESAVPKSMKGRRDPVIIDIRKFIKDGVVADPESALEHVSDISRLLEQKRNGLNRSDVSVVYGGLLPVPFTFLTGFMIDDESAIVTMDWNRNKNKWQQLDEDDDGNRFAILGLDSIPENAEDVVVAVSVSYKVNMPAIHETFGDLPIVHLDLSDGNTDCHWSEEKQSALAKEFLDTINALDSKRVNQIHLVIVAQNSVVFRLGRSYDKRNLPKATIYQYEQSSHPPYPWGIVVPTHGIDKASIKYNS